MPVVKKLIFPYMSDEDFEDLVNKAIDSIDEQYIKKLDNVAITIADFPTRRQLHKVKARPGSTLFGLYEGVSQIRRGTGYSWVLPDKITIFKVPLLCMSTSQEDLVLRVRDTVWHEIAHHFGMDHKQIHAHKNRK